MDLGEILDFTNRFTSSLVTCLIDLIESGATEAEPTCQTVMSSCEKWH
jgi:hypothetical protein